MTCQNEKSPLTLDASGRENGTEIEARGLSSADNGTPAENLSQDKGPASVQASGATAQRPGMDSTFTGVVPAAESIGELDAGGGNETSSKLRLARGNH